VSFEGGEDLRGGSIVKENVLVKSEHGGEHQISRMSRGFECSRTFRTYPPVTVTVASFARARAEIPGGFVP
jgi:hypothetical protein